MTSDYFTLILTLTALGFIVGALGAWLIAKFRFQATYTSKEQLAELYVSKALYEQLQKQEKAAKDEVFEREEEIRILTSRLSSTQQIVYNLEDKLEFQKKELDILQERSRMEFENLANRLLEEKSQKFSSQNQDTLNNILSPLKERITAFEMGIEKRFIEETKDRVSLQKEIEHLRLLNQQLSEDANRLAEALKGSNKTQGDWGELQLEVLLEKAGLAKDIHYVAQPNYKDDEGQNKRPDFIINLPDDRQLIIDSKVSLIAYERYFHAETEVEQQEHIQEHISSIKQHIKDLSSKDYQNLYQINTPDYLLLFIPIESAFALAVQQDNQIFNYALDKNIVLVTTSTLLATMRTVAYIWKQEKQKRSVQEIARQSGMLYDKFCRFVDDLQSIGNRLNQAQGAYQDAIRKLSSSKKYGDSLIGRAERIKELGAKTSKSLPQELLDLTELNGLEEE